MTQEEKWLAKYNEVKIFIETNHRNPSNYEGAERELRNWIRHSKKLMNAGLLKAERVEPFKQLLELIDGNKHKNQYM